MMKIRKTILIILASGFFLQGTLYAEEGKSKTEVMTQSTHKSVIKIKEMMTKGDNKKALMQLETLYSTIEKETMDEAIVAQMIGYAAMDTNDYKRSIASFQKTVSLNLLPATANNNMRYMIAQMLANQNQYKEAIPYAEEWYKDAGNTKPMQNIFMANMYVQAKQYKQAIPYINKAIDAEKTPNESWYQMLLGCHYELNEYSQAAIVLNNMIGIWVNKKSYWEQLAGVYLKLGRDAESLALLELAWRSGILEQESSIKNLIQFAINYGVPERAARLLDQAVKENKLKKDVKSLEVLAGAWTRAKETDQSIKSYQNLIAVSGSGAHMMQLARLYIEKEDWPNAEKTLQQSLQKEGVDQSKAYLLLGIAYIKDNKLDQGKETLRKAAAFEKMKSQANAWINYANQKQQSQNTLAQAETKK
jgi:hypothetical protein